MSKKMWSESDLRLKEGLSANIQTLTELAEHNKRLLLKLERKYQEPEAKQPHNLVR